jgi:hypothetical protein
MAVNFTYVPIATQTLGSATNSISFTSIPQTYNDLVLVIQTKQTSSSNYGVFGFNSDTGSNYSQTAMHGNGSSVFTERGSNTFIAPLFYAYESTTNWLIANINIMNYSNTTTYKTVLYRGNDATTATQAGVGLWRNTTAITSIQYYTGGTSFTAGSNFTLYGIASA